MKEQSPVRRRLHQAHVLARYAYRHPKEFIKKSIKSYKEAKTNVSEGGMAVSSALFVASLAVPPLITTFTYLTHEVTKNLPVSTVNHIAIGAVGLASLLNIYLEAKALREKGFSNNIPASALYLASKMENVTAFVSNFYHLGLLAGLNGASMEVINALIGSKGKYLSENVITTAIIYSTWNSLTLIPIIKGTIDPFVNKINNISSKVKTKLVDSVRLYNEG